jgi:conjugative relaxase-like TrwC/TraI family protein
MIRHKQFTTGTGRSGAAKYFTEHLSVSDYYAKGVGLLQGQAFEHVGMQFREVDLAVFTSLEQNHNPETGEKFTPRTNKTRKEWWFNPETGRREVREVDDRRSGMDLPMIVPKTVSEVWSENRETEFGRAIYLEFISAKDRAMALAESLAMTRVRRGDADYSRYTGNLLYLSVIHEDARPVGSDVPDPMLHAHNYIFNLTWDEEECRLKAVDLHDVLKRAETIDALFLSELERGLQRLGIGTERTADNRSFEITAVKGKEIFSKRRNEILREEFGNRDRIETLARYRVRAAARLGKTLDYDKVKTEIKNEIGKATAKRKVVLTFEEKLAGLRAQMTPEIRASLQEEAVKAGERRNWRTPEEAKEEVLFSAFKNFSVVHELEIVGQLLRAAGGGITFEDALAYARSSAFIRLDGEGGHVTTERVRQEERQMLATVKDAWGKCPALIPGEREIQDPMVMRSANQSGAARFLWTSGDMVMDISGIAGAGKTTLLREVVPALRSEGISVLLLAPTAASEKHLRSEFPGAMTLQKFQTDLELQHDTSPGTVIVLDEVSMVSVPQLCRLVAFIAERGCRLVLCGDRDQHSSPERGEAIRILQDSHSVRSVRLTETFRPQVPYLKETILDLKAHRRKEGYERLDAHGDIIEIEDPFELREAAVELHLEAARAGHIAILASPVHAEAREAAAIVRETLKGEGLIAEDDHRITRLARLAAEGVELKDPLHYQIGRVVTFHTKVAGGFRPGEKWQVAERLSADMFVFARENERKNFDLTSKGKWSLYDTEEMAVSVGDQIRITEGFMERGVAFRTNDIAKVKAVELDHIELEDGRRLRRDFVHIDQGVCITSYASECRTVRQVVAIAPLNSFAEMHAKTFYVLASRATHRAVFFTDCKEAFKEAVLRPGERVAVWDCENRDEQNAERDKGAGSRYADDEERYAAAEARDDQGSMFHAGEEDLQAFWDLHREESDLQKTAAQQHTMKPNQEREINNERHY